jgi:23S rRNA pseudouridine1911/1915/1917 synthase
MIVIIPETHAGVRADKALAELTEGLSRVRVQGLIAAGDVRVDGAVFTDGSRKFRGGERVEIFIPAPEDPKPGAQAIALHIVIEDDDLLVINKQAGLTVHPGAGTPDGTLVNALIHHCGSTLSGIGGVKRPGIVHRLDKDTSGLMVVAKNDMAHQGLSQQLSDRTLSRVYKAFVFGHFNLPKGVVDKPIGRHKGSRVKMSIGGIGAREAKTSYRRLEAYGEAAALVECRLESGRTHQIRVHMAHIRHPLIGDPVYGIQRTQGASLLKRAGLPEKEREDVLAFPRQALHAAEIGFIHPRTGEEMRFEEPFPDDLVKLHNILKSIGKL